MSLINQCFKSSFLLFLCISLFPIAGFSQVLINFDAQELSLSKKALQDKTANPESLQAYQKLLQQADGLLSINNQTVMDKTFMPMSNDKHDYLSLSRYWWPDPSKKDGLPWIRKDGYTNPDTQQGNVDKRRIEFTTKSIQALSFAYYFSDEEKYAEKGVSWIRAWFLDADTHMNPNLEHAQRVPGNARGRRSGILDGRIIPQRILDAITLFSKSKYWTKQDNQKMNAWLSEYLTWLTDSELGKEGAKQTNNHGAWYCYQVAAISFYLGDNEKLKQAITLAKSIFAIQFEANGAQPHELKRTRSYFYSTFNLDALTSVAMVADRANLSFWDTKAKNGATLLTGINFLIPASNGAEWPYKSKSGVRAEYLLASLIRIPKQVIKKEQQDLLKQLLQGLKSTPNKAKYQTSIYNKFLLYRPSYL